jgi:hypothetical protein
MSIAIESETKLLRALKPMNELVLLINDIIKIGEPARTNQKNPLLLTNTACLLAVRYSRYSTS